MEIPRITARDAKRLMDTEAAVFLDSRNPQAWAESSAKLPGAIRLPADEVRQHLNLIPSLSVA